MAELKTKARRASVARFIAGLSDPETRRDCRTLVTLMTAATKQKPVMWGPSIVGFGRYHYVYDSGHEGDSCIVGFSPRKQNLTLYLGGGFSDGESLLAKLGKHKRGKGCLYVKRLDDVHVPTLNKLIRRSADRVARRYS
jgi:hypothetical protein